MKKEAKKTPLVFLDPGHGGTDTSNQSPDGLYKEHEFSLDIGKRIRALLQKQGIAVGMTRTDNTSVSLSGRADLANQNNADLFVSLHSNALAGGWTSASGLVVYTYAEGGVRDVMANNILKRMHEAGVKTFGAELYHSKFAVLKYSNMPACLIEYGFHTNKSDVALLKSSEYRDKLALATANGICDTLGITYKDGAKKYSLALSGDKATAEKAAAKLKEIGITATIQEEDA